MKKLDFMGVKINWDAFEAAQMVRWEKLPSGLFHCKVHNTFFDYEATDTQNEPCWKCYDEFTET